MILLEEASKQASAEVASWLFLITGTPVSANGNDFSASWNNYYSGQGMQRYQIEPGPGDYQLLAANMFLRTTWRRALLVGAVIPLGLLRNGLRILVISLLCVHIGPQMIHSVIHRRGGPVFFVASLVPLFIMLWLLRRGDMPAQQRSVPTQSEIDFR